MNDLLVIDYLQASRPSRERFLEWREDDVGCVHVTLAIWENARETLTAIGIRSCAADPHHESFHAAGRRGSGARRTTTARSQPSPYPGVPGSDRHHCVHIDRIAS